MEFTGESLHLGMEDAKPLLVPPLLLNLEPQPGVLLHTLQLTAHHETVKRILAKTIKSAKFNVCGLYFPAASGGTPP